MTQPKIDGVGHGKPVMPFGSDGTDWYAFLIDALGHLQVDVVSAALGSGGATATNQTTMITALQLIDDLRNALGSVATDKVLVASKSGDKIFGFESIVEEQVSEGNLAAGTNYLTGTTVPAGKIWKITTVTNYYDGTVPSTMTLYVMGLANNLPIMNQHSVVSKQWYFWSGEVYLQAGDYMMLEITGATAGDDANMKYAGVQMNAP